MNIKENENLAFLLQDFIEENALNSELLMSAIQIQGVVTAMAAAPYQINPSEWLTIFWNQTPSSFQHGKQLEDFANIIVNMWNHARQTLLSGQWEWPKACKVNTDQLPNLATQHFCEGLLQGWRLTLDDWHMLMPEQDPNNALLHGVLLSISILFEPQKIPTTPEQAIDIAQFAEIYHAMPMMLAGITIRAAEMISSQIKGM